MYITNMDNLREKAIEILHNHILTECTVICDNLKETCDIIESQCFKTSNTAESYSYKILSCTRKLNNKCIEMINKQEIEPKDIQKTESYIFHDDLKKNRDMILSSISTIIKASLNLYACPHCKKRNHTKEETQTRSLDEGVTITCECNECGKIWRP